MVKIYLSTFLLHLCCYLSASAPLSFESNERKVYTFKDFDQLVLNGAFEVFLYQGEKEEIILEGPAHLLEDIKVNQRGVKVIVGDKPYKNRSIRKVTLHVYLTNLHQLEINGISRLQCKTTIKSSHLKLYCNGIRNVEFDLSVGDLQATFDGIGSTYLSGRVNVADIECAGLGNLYATELIVDVLHFESAGIGKAEIFAGKELHVDVAGIGTVRYAGNPEIKSISKDGIGKVRPLW